MKYIVNKSNANFFIYFLGLIFGLSFPDFDYFFENLIGHRSFFTHSILITLIFSFFFKTSALKISDYITGISVGIIIHLISDLNLPSNFTNIQTIKFFTYDFGKNSFFWILINIVIGSLITEKSKIFAKRIKIEIFNLIIFSVYIYFTSEIYWYLLIFYICLRSTFYLIYKIKIKKN